MLPIDATSDARSGQVVDDRIRPALESGATVGSTKPALLVVDEVDGATGGDNVGIRHALFANVLLCLRGSAAVEQRVRPQTCAIDLG